MINVETISNIQTPHGRIQQIQSPTGIIWNSTKRYGYRREKANANPSDRITYLYDAVGKKPMAVNLADNTVDYGDWKEFIDEICRPVMLKYDGTVDYELDHNDQTYRIDGAGSDIKNEFYQGNAMVEFRKYKWVHRYEDDKYEYVIFSNKQCDENYKAHAFTNSTGDCQDNFYFAIYTSYMHDSQMRSLASKTITANQTVPIQIQTAENNGKGWYLQYKSGRDYINDILTLISKTDNAQSAFGYGRCSTSNTENVATGQYINNSAFCGSNDQVSEVKVLYMEGLWGNIWERMEGFIYDQATGVRVKMTPPYSLTSEGYETIGVKYSSAESGYIKNTSCTNDYGSLITGIGGSSSTYMCDGYRYDNAITGFANIGGSHNLGLEVGPRFISLKSKIDYGSATVATRLAYIKETYKNLPDIENPDFEYVCDNNVPDPELWDYPIDEGTVTYDPELNSMKLYSVDTSHEAGLRRKDYAQHMGQKAIYEVTFYASDVNKGSCGLQNALGSLDASNNIAGKGIHTTLRTDTTTGLTWLHVLSGSESVTTNKNTAIVSLNKWHTIRLVLDTIADKNEVYLDDKLVCTQTNSQLSTLTTKYIWSNVKRGTVWIKSVKYKKIA